MTKAKKHIIIHGASSHNLKNISLKIPRDKFIVITGMSGSGKSSLAFDTIYAEGQRRYVESLSSYARQFLGQMDKPEVEYIEGLSPAISIEQKSSIKNPRSTVGTITEIYDYLRLLFARTGVCFCPECSKPLHHQSIDEMAESIINKYEDKNILVLAPLVRDRKGEFKNLFEHVAGLGFNRVLVDGKILKIDSDSEPLLIKNIRHNIWIIIDRIKIKDNSRSRVFSSIETAIENSGGLVGFSLMDTPDKVDVRSEDLACPDCGISFEDLSPRMFSFNAPQGACPECHGLGDKLEFDESLIVPDSSLSISQGAIATLKSPDGKYYGTMLSTIAGTCGFSLDQPFKSLPEKFQKIVLYGSGKTTYDFEFLGKRSEYRYQGAFEGIIPNLERRFKETSSDGMRNWIKGFMASIPCTACNGARLSPKPLAVKINGMSISDITNMSIGECKNFFSGLKLTKRELEISERVLKEIITRLDFLINVGLDYLNLSRNAATLSGGETQRIRLATQIGSALVGVLYVLDEPSIGLHQRDNQRLLNSLTNLRDLGNTLIVVEHDEETIRAADHIVDMGPGAGENGGEVIFSGSLPDLLKCPVSLTGKYLSGQKSIEVPLKRRKKTKKGIKIINARENNLKNIDVFIPAGLITCVTGVSGSGKSSLINGILYKAAFRDISNGRCRPGKHGRIEGFENFDKVINIDQSPIGRTPRSNPATYTNIFGYIRDIFSNTKLAKARGYKPGRFSFNVRGGRCEACEGAGVITIEMHFLPNVYVKCETCHGKRFNRETLEVKYRDKNIYDVLDMSVTTAISFFEAHPNLKNKLQTLEDVGLGYIRLGQASTTLSGGEAQRVKLATELSKRATGKTLYILDEPTTGLHFEDVRKLLEVIKRLGDQGNTIIIIEHNLDVIKCADWIIDLGPEGGDRGGTVIAAGTPEEVAENTKSHTGRFLGEIIKKR
jgi:excinuclease ABC subunit A